MLTRIVRGPLFTPAIVLWRYSEGFRRQVVVYVTLSVCATLVMLMVPLTVAWLLNVVQRAPAEERFAQAFWPLLTLVTIPIVSWLLHGPSRIMEQRVAFRVKTRLLMSKFQKVTALPTRWQKEHHSGETIDKISRAGDAIGEFTTKTFQLLQMVVNLVTSIVILLVFMTPAGLAVGLAFLFSMVVIVRFDRVLIVNYWQLNDRFSRVNAAIQDYLTNIGTVISLRLEDCVNGELRARVANIAPLNSKTIVINEWKWAVTSIAMTLMRIGIVAFYVGGKMGVAFEIGTLYALWEYLRRIENSFSDFSWLYGDTIMKGVRLRATDYIDEAYDAMVAPSEGATLREGWQTLNITSLYFHHEEAQPNAGIIDGISFKLERGTSYAIIGESGSGKSTVLAILRGLLDADSVEVFCDGQELLYGLSHVHHRAALVPQKPEIVADTIRFNVTFGIPAEDSVVLDVIERAKFTDVLSRLPQGLDTNIAEKGVNLSGGECQRLALARGLFFAELNGSDIILLDEPTSSVDITNEYEIYRSLLERHRSRCIVSALHKMSLLPLFDEIIVMAKGKIVEKGTLVELLAKGGDFAALWDKYHRQLPPCPNEDVEAADVDECR